MNKKIFKFCFVCITAFLLLNVKSDNSYAKELSAKNFEEIEEMLSDARRNALEEEPYIISVQAGQYNVGYEINMPSYTTLNFEQDAKINYTGSSEYVIRIKSGTNDVTINGGVFSDGGIIVTGGNNIIIENTTVDSPVNAGIVFKGENTNSSIIGNTVKNSERFSIALMGASFDGDIRENTITNSSDIALYLYNSTLKGDIYENTIEDCAASAFYAGNTPIDGDIRKNTIKNVKGNGIGIYHGSHVNAIDNNELIDIGGMHDGFNGDCGIHINADEGPGKKANPTYAKSITNNTLKNITYSGIALYSGPSGGKR